MHRREPSARVVTALLVLLALALACDRGRPPPAPADTPPTPGPATAPEPAQAPPPPPATPPPPAPASAAVREASALQPGDAVAPLAADGETVVDPSAHFRVVLEGTSADARLALHDALDAAVPASATAEVGPATVLTLTPAAPLSPGSRYRLVLDGAATRELHVGERPFTPAAYAVKAAGEPAPARPARRSRPRPK